MDKVESLSHTAWECKYHVVLIPKYRRKTLYGELRRHLAEVFLRLAERRESDRGGAFGAGSRAYDDFDTAEVFRVAGDLTLPRIDVLQKVNKFLMNGERNGEEVVGAESAVHG